MFIYSITQKKGKKGIFINWESTGFFKVIQRSTGLVMEVTALPRRSGLRSQHKHHDHPSKNRHERK